MPTPFVFCAMSFHAFLAIFLVSWPWLHNFVNNLSRSQYLLMKIMDLDQRTQCACVKFSNICLYSLVDASFKNLMDWHTCFLSLLYKKCGLGCCSWISQYLTKFHISSQFFASHTPFSFPLSHFHEVFGCSFCSLHLQAMGKQCTNSNSVNVGDLSKGCRGTLDNVQGSPQARPQYFIL